MENVDITKEKYRERNEKAIENVKMKLETVENELINLRVKVKVIENNIGNRWIC